MGKLLKTLNGLSHRTSSHPDSKIAAGDHHALNTEVNAIPFQLAPTLDALEPLFDGLAVPFFEVPAAVTAIPELAATQPVSSQETESTNINSTQSTNESSPTTNPSSALWLKSTRPVSQALQPYEEMGRALCEILKERSLSALMLVPFEHEHGFVELSVHLGRLFAEFMQQPVLLIDATLNANQLQRWLPVATAPGWEELLQGLDVSQAIQKSGHMGLDVIASGNRLSQTSPALWAREAGKLLRNLQRFYRLLVMNSPAWPQSPASLVLATEMAASCVVHSRQQQQHPWLATLMDSLQNQHALLGSILVDG